MSTYLSVDPDTRIIDITKVPSGGLLSLDVQIDIYSDLKEDWLAIPALQSLRFPLRSFGDPKNPTQTIGPYMFVRNQDGWRFRSHDSDHELAILGNLIPEDVTLPVFLSRPGRTIVITQEQSNQALTLAIGSGLSIDEATKLLELWQMMRLDPNNPRETDEDGTIRVGGKTITANTVGTTPNRTTTQTRQP